MLFSVGGQVCLLLVISLKLFREQDQFPASSVPSRKYKGAGALYISLPSPIYSHCRGSLDSYIGEEVWWIQRGWRTFLRASKAGARNGNAEADLAGVSEL